jgi:ATP-dependent metalloprotease
MAALLTEGADPVHKVTILPRGFSGGATYSLPRDEDYHTRQNVLASIDVCMGGRAAEELVNGVQFVTTGAGSDMRQASSLARRYVMAYSMSDLGLSYYNSEEAGARPSPDKQAIIDAEVERVLSESYRRVLALLRLRRADLDLLAAALLEHETLSADECRDVLAGKTLPPVRAKLDAGGGGGGEADAKGSRKASGDKAKQGKVAAPPAPPSVPKIGGVWN